MYATFHLNFELQVIEHLQKEQALHELHILSDPNRSLADFTHVEDGDS